MFFMWTWVLSGAQAFPLMACMCVCIAHVLVQVEVRVQQWGEEGKGEREGRGRGVDNRRHFGSSLGLQRFAQTPSDSL
jgi:hypothetical protein